MKRVDTFGFRTDEDERKMIALVAKRLERSESDAMRLILRQVAQQLGCVPAQTTDDRKAA